MKVTLFTKIQVLTIVVLQKYTKTLANK